MAGRFRDEDIAAVREKARIDEVVGDQVQLRNGGGGNLMGICPFHDEKSPSLSVSPSRNLYHCFGCGVGGDVISFVQRIEHLSFTEAVEKLAARIGIVLRYVDGPPTGAQPVGQRARLIEANALAAGFYADQLALPEAEKAHSFLSGRGFDAAAVQRFGCGYAPSGWDALTKYLLGRGFKPAELTLAGLARESGRGSLIDRFHRRLLWPIKDIGGDVVGFGARRLYDDDKVEAKYLNTPETPLYKKSQLLYGMDVAKREIARENTAVIVEGYTDVMACHLAGITTAVATCGTSFGSDHIGILRRLLLDSNALTGEVIFTFDGDAAGMKAAERAFSDDQKFMTQTYVAVESSGKDPCELRQSGGDEAVRALVGSRRPLVEFVLETVVKRHKLESAEGQIAALDQAVPLVASIKDMALRDEYARRLAGLVGVGDPNRIVARVRGLVRSNSGAGKAASGPGFGALTAGASVPRDGTSPRDGSAPNVSVPNGSVPNGSVPNAQVPNAQLPNAPVSPKVMQTEREALKAALQLPEVVATLFDALTPGSFVAAEHQQLHAAIIAAGGAGRGLAGPSWPLEVAQHLPPDSAVRAEVNALAVEPLRARPADQPSYVRAVLLGLTELVLSREMTVLRSRLQRSEAGGDKPEAGVVQVELQRLERRRRELREQAQGGAA